MGVSSEILSVLERSLREGEFDSAESSIRKQKSGGWLFRWKSDELLVSIDFLQEDSIGILLTLLSMEKTKPEVQPDYLRNTAGKISKQVNYLMEPLRIVELDSTNNVVQMRSEKPEQSSGGISYFECL